MKKILRELGPYTGELVLSLVLTLGGTAGELFLPRFLSQILNQDAARTSGSIVRIGLAMMGITLLAMAANVLSAYYSSRMAAGFAKNLRGQVFRAVEGFSQVEFDRFGPASLITRNTNDVVQLQNFLMMLVRVLVRAPILIVGGVVLALNQSPTLAKPLVFSIPSILILIVIVSRILVPLFKQLQKKVDRVNLVLREKLTGIRVIRAFVTEDYEEERFDGVNRDLTRTNLKMLRTMSLMMPLLMLLMNATTIGIIASGGVQVLAGGDLQAGDIIAVIQYVMQILFSLVMMSMIFVLYPRAAASADRIAQVLNTELSITDNASQPRPTCASTIEFQDVSFTFPGAERPTLQHISFRSGPGETTAIIGSTGSGKSSLVNLIPRFYDVTGGRILVDGVDIRDWNQADLRAKIGYVPQRGMLFSGTVESNIRTGSDRAAEEEIRQAAEIAQAAEFIDRKEEGFQSPVSQGATNLSGGQKQRLAIARAIVRKPEIYLFDDSFSALDFQTDAKLRAALKEHVQDATVLLVAQRISTIMDADRILVLSEGELVGLGTHKELLETCAVYQEIVTSQFSDEEVAG